MTPELRRALHECVDILCDALAASGREPVKQRRRRAARVHEMPPEIDEVTRKRAELVAKRAGWA